MTTWQMETIAIDIGKRLRMHGLELAGVWYRAQYPTITLALLRTQRAIAIAYCLIGYLSMIPSGHYLALYCMTLPVLLSPGSPSAWVLISG